MPDGAMERVRHTWRGCPEAAVDGPAASSLAGRWVLAEMVDQLRRQADVCRGRECGEPLLHDRRQLTRGRRIGQAELAAFVVYDTRLSSAAAAAGLPVLAPSPS